MRIKSQSPSSHWADISADRVIRERGNKKEYVCASGITPSGTVHIGNFREIISVDLVVRALRDRGAKVRFIYSWDDYDVFRKVPENMPEQELLQTYLRKPITLVPDVVGKEKSYAAQNEKSLENILPLVGINPEFLYQAERYRSSFYAEGIKTALDHQETIRKLLNTYRHTALADDWQAVNIFCTRCEKDSTTLIQRQGDYGLQYSCASCAKKESIDLRKTSAVKLPWRIDWPMRWAQESVDFEPAGKDHHSEGGSFDTAKLISKEVYHYEAPTSFQYDFVRIKGGSGKISSSVGDVVSLEEVLKYYQPELVRFLFAGTRPNSEFAISFDLDLLKIYEDYDKIERAYFHKPDNPKKHKKWEKDARIYELSQVARVPQKLPFQVPIRHLSTLLQIYSGDIDMLIKSIKVLPPDDALLFRRRAICAWNWLRNFAPEDFRFSLRNSSEKKINFPKKTALILGAFRALVDKELGKHEEKEFGILMYQLMKEQHIESSDFFPAVYQKLIGKEKGPRLINFLHVIGREKLMELLLP